MITTISIEDVRRELKVLKELSRQKHLVKFHDACEDANNVYIIMELCEGVVLELSPNGSLAFLLYGSKDEMKWGIKFKVTLRTAESLRYLHEGCKQRY